MSVPEAVGDPAASTSLHGRVRLEVCTRGATRFRVLLGWDGIIVRPTNCSTRFRPEAHDSTMTGVFLQTQLLFGKGTAPCIVESCIPTITSSVSSVSRRHDGWSAAPRLVNES